MMGILNTLYGCAVYHDKFMPIILITSSYLGMFVPENIQFLIHLMNTFSRINFNVCLI